MSGQPTGPVTMIRVVSIALILTVAGCEPDLETGYMPHKLNGSENDRRAFYAPAFSPQSKPQATSAAPDVGQHGPGRY